MIALWYARDYFVGLWVVLYLVLVLTLGVITLRKGHILWFILGFFIPFCWIIGAVLPDRRRRREERRDLRLDQERP
jgi:hypothetical protein